MKTLILSSSIFFASCCNCTDESKQIYTLELVYDNGNVDTTEITKVGKNYFSLSSGDLTTYSGYGNGRTTVSSGVRSFKVLGISKELTPVKIDTVSSVLLDEG